MNSSPIRSTLHVWRFLSTFRLALMLASGLLVVLMAQPAAALGGSSLLTDRVMFEGRVYNAFLTAAGELVVPSTLLDGSGYREDYLGGVAVTRPTLAVNEGGTLMVVYVANASGQLYMRGKKAGAAWTGWAYLGDGVIDQPQAYGGRMGVGVTVTRGDYRRWTKTTTDGVGTEANWIDNEGKLIPIGTNATTAVYESAARRDSDLSTMHPRIMRVRMYMDCCGSETPRFSYTDLNRMRDNGMRILVLNTSEAITDVSRFVRQINQIDIGGGTVLGWARANPNVMVLIELGNEPDRVQADYAGTPSYDYYSPWNTRLRALDIADHWNANYRGTNKNVEIMISQPTLIDGVNYFDAFNSNPDGRGRVGDKFRHVGVHTYSFGCLDRQHAGGESQGNVMTIIDKAKASTLGGVYITEVAINSKGQTLGSRFTNLPEGEDRRWAELGRRYVRALENFDSVDGRIKGVMFFHDDRSWNYSYRNANAVPYNMDEGTQAGAHAHWALGNRANDSDCPIDKRVPQGGGVLK